MRPRRHTRPKEARREISHTRTGRAGLVGGHVGTARWSPRPGAQQGQGSWQTGRRVRESSAASDTGTRCREGPKGGRSPGIYTRWPRLTGQVQRTRQGPGSVRPPRPGDQRTGRRGCSGMRRGRRPYSATSTGDQGRGGQEYIYRIYTEPNQRRLGEVRPSRCRRGAGGREDHHTQKSAR